MVINKLINNESYCRVLISYDILSCKLDLCATLNQTKIVILSIFFNFLYVSKLYSFLALQIFTKLQKNVIQIHINILPSKLDLFETTKNDFVDIF